MRLALICCAISTGWISGAAAKEKPGKTPEVRRKAEAAYTPAKHRLYYWNGLGLRANPLGAVDQFRLSYRYRLFESDSILLRDTFVGAGVVPTVSPAWWRMGGFFEVQPIAALRLSAQYDYLRYMGSFGVMQSFPNATADFSDTALDLGRDAGNTYVTSGTQLTISALLRLKVGPVALRSNFRFARVDVALRAGDTVYYDILYDLLAPGKGWMLVNDTDVLYLTKFGLVLGARYSLGTAWYDESQLPPGADNPNVPIQRLGLIVAYRFFKHDGSRFANPTVALIAQWWLSHRWRTGADVSQGLPYMAIAFTFEGDLWSSR